MNKSFSVSRTRSLQAAVTKRPQSSSNPSVSSTLSPKSQVFPFNNCHVHLTPNVADSSAVTARECFSSKRWNMRKQEEPNHLRKSSVTPPTARARKSASRTTSPSNAACNSHWKTQGYRRKTLTMFPPMRLARSPATAKKPSPSQTFSAETFPFPA